jgi:hypothetical protein
MRTATSFELESRKSPIKRIQRRYNNVLGQRTKNMQQGRKMSIRKHDSWFRRALCPSYLRRKLNSGRTTFVDCLLRTSRTNVPPPQSRDGIWTCDQYLKQNRSRLDEECDLGIFCVFLFPQRAIDSRDSSRPGGPLLRPGLPFWRLLIRKQGWCNFLIIASRENWDCSVRVHCYAVVKGRIRYHIFVDKDDK